MVVMMLGILIPPDVWMKMLQIMILMLLLIMRVVDTFVLLQIILKNVLVLLVIGGRMSAMIQRVILLMLQVLMIGFIFLLN